MQTAQTVEELKEIARKCRIDIIRMITKAGNGHPGGSLSAIDIITTLYFRLMNHRPNEPQWPDRDRFILSKGHGAPALYTALAHSGYFKKELLMTLRELGSPLQGHPDKTRVPGLEASTGSLGQGLSVAQGAALAGKLDKKAYNVFCIIGDGETQEGQIWETAMSAPKFKLDNLIVFTDKNRGQIDGRPEEVMPIEPLSEKWKAFGWHVQTIDGHNIQSILDAVENAKASKGKPHQIIAETIKGKGVSFMENEVGWHGIAPNREQCETALKELEAAGGAHA